LIRLIFKRPTCCVVFWTRWEQQTRSSS